LEIPSSIKECGIEKSEFMNSIDELADKAFEDQCTTANPRMPLVDELKQIYLDAYHGY
jgi:acetaldehyde dehydrogenase/alcohol dehydrogenase